MKILQAVAFLITIFIFSGCSDYGEKYSYDKNHHVYYKGDGVNETQAKDLAGYLKKAGYYLDGHDADVQITKTKDTVNINFVVNMSKVTPEIEQGFLVFCAGASKEVFSNSPVTIHFCDNTFKEVKNLGIAKEAEN
jgi:hypothetical protein